tara:strand:- start:27 stop:266 length:240 start_codon:yes stop_codon:yes gene_type:complete
MKNTVQKGVSFWSHGNIRNNHGRTINIQIAERLEIFFHKKIPTQTKATVRAILKCKTAKTPNKVEIPFPPLKRRKTEKI